MSLLHRRRYAAVVLAPALLLFSGCMIGPDFKPPTGAVSESWLGSKDRRVSVESATNRNWWTTFDDPVLNHLVERAYRENLSLRQAGVRVLQAWYGPGDTSGYELIYAKGDIQKLDQIAEMRSHSGYAAGQH